MLADGDYVILHVHAVRTPGERGSAIVDIFKLENGKIVEHWDVVAADSGEGSERQRDVLARRRSLMAQAQTPRGINHLVLNVRDIEVSHRFWTEIMGFRCVAELKPQPGGVRPKMRFYSGVAEGGDVTHHDLALAEVPEGRAAAAGGRPRRGA